jgi:hypothetical protein
MKRSNHEHLRPRTRTHDASQVHRLALRLTMEALSASVCFPKQERLEQLRFSSILAIHFGLRSPIDHEGRLGMRKAEQTHKRVCSDAHFYP